MAAKTEQERAQESLDAANRKVAKLRKQESKLADELEVVKGDLKQAIATRDYRAMHPALPQKAQGSAISSSAASTSAEAGPAGGGATGE